MGDPTGDYQQGFYDGVSKIREMVVQMGLGLIVPDPLGELLKQIDALLHAPPAV